jgi:hypothetical protein
MPSLLHEGIVELFRVCPAISALALETRVSARALRQAAPAIGKATFNRSRLTPYASDLVIVFRRRGKAVLAVIVEVQLRCVRRKRRVWPVYAASLRAELDCPVALLVVCVSEGVARWAATPIALGPGGSAIEPLVLGPDSRVLLATPFDVQVAPEWAVLRAVALARTRYVKDAVRAAFRVMRGLDDDQLAYYANLIYSALTPAMRRELEAEMVQTLPRDSLLARKLVSLGRQEGRQKGRQEGRQEGLQEGRAQALLTVLAAREITITKRQRAVVLGCTDAATLDEWIRNAASATNAREVFVR